MKRTNLFLYFLGILVVLTGLGYFAYQGFYNRYWSDDWCYNRDFSSLGILKTIGLYFATGEDASRGWPLNRYAMTLFSGITYIPGVAGTQFLAAITIGIWWASFNWVLSNIVKIKNLGIPQSLTILFSGIILYYDIYFSTDRFQILYWRSGVIPYSLSIIFGLILFGIITNQMLGKNSSINIYLAAITGFIGGGLSEIGCSFLLSGITLLLVAAWRQKHLGKEWANRSYSTIQTAWLALLISLVLLAISPANSRYTTMQDSPNSPLMVPFYSVQSALLFIFYSLKNLPIPHLVLFMLFVSLSILERGDVNKIMDTKQAVGFMFITILITILLITAIQAPTTYLYSSPPDPRGQSLSRFTMTIGLAFTTWFMAAGFRKYLPIQLTFIFTIVILAGYVYTGRAIYSTFKDLPGFVQRAQLWDERDSFIREAVKQGATRLEVPVIDTQDIGTKDIMRSKDMERWVSNCAASYYGLQEIKALVTDP